MAEKVIMLEKQYMYVKASKGFQLKGTSTEVIPTNTGFYRFLVSNVAEALGNSYVTVIYDDTDTEFIAYCTDLFLEEIQNTIVVAVENIQSAVQGFASTNHQDITDFATGVSGALQLLNGNLEKVGNSIYLEKRTDMFGQGHFGTYAFDVGVPYQILFNVTNSSGGIIGQYDAGVSGYCFKSRILAAKGLVSVVEDTTGIDRFKEYCNGVCFGYFNDSEWFRQNYPTKFTFNGVGFLLIESVNLWKGSN